MDALKKILGIVWILLALVVLYFGLTVMGIPKLSSGKQEDLVFGIIIVFILLPIVYTEKSLKKFLLKRHELPPDYVDPDKVKRQRTKGFRDR